MSDKPAARTTDSVQNHPPCSPPFCGPGSENVIIEFLQAYRVTDFNTPHGVPPFCIPHSTPLAVGSTKVYVNNLQAGRIGDTHSCGLPVTSGASKTRIGG